MQFGQLTIIHTPTPNSEPVRYRSIFAWKTYPTDFVWNKTKQFERVSDLNINFSAIHPYFFFLGIFFFTSGSTNVTDNMNLAAS